MSKYLLTATYFNQGIKGLLEMGGTPRRDNATGTIEGLGGTVECFYYSFGEDGSVSVMVVCEFDDISSAHALSLWINSSGRVQGVVKPLMTVEECDAIAKRMGEKSAARDTPTN